MNPANAEVNLQNFFNRSLRLEKENSLVARLRCLKDINIYILYVTFQLFSHLSCFGLFQELTSHLMQIYSTFFEKVSITSELTTWSN